MTTARPRVALLFPGQGLQQPGMGSWLFRAAPDAPWLLRSLSERLDLDLARLCARGPADTLGQTQYTQPAVFAVGMAAYWCLAGSGVAPLTMLGHSVGEISALCASGALTVEQAIDLVTTRGRLMAAAPGPGRMGLIRGLTRDQVQDCCAASGPPGAIVIGVQNAPVEHAVSGTEAAVARCLELAGERGAQRATLMRASHAFHSPMMEPILDQWRAVVQSLAIARPAGPVILNVSARSASDTGQIRAELVDQVTSPVEWWSSMCMLADLGVELAVVCGTDKYLTSLARLAGLRALSFADPRQRAAILSGSYWS
jgi:[acyl-carrier-protein] S-malonyltransferase